MDWIRTRWTTFQRAREADRRGWGSIGRMLADGRRWSDAKLRRELRRSNRLYRIANGKSPWHPFNGF